MIKIFADNEGVSRPCSESELVNLRWVGDGLRAAIASIQASCKHSAKETRALGRTLQKRQSELNELQLKLDDVLEALPVGLVNVPRLDNRKKVLTLTATDEIADLDRQGYPTEWIAGQAGCSRRYIKMVVQMSGFSEDIRAAIDEKVSSADFALKLVNLNGKDKTCNFLRKATEWYRTYGYKVRQNKFLLTNGTVGEHARLMGVEALRVK